MPDTPSTRRHRRRTVSGDSADVIAAAQHPAAPVSPPLPASLADYDIYLVRRPKKDKRIMAHLLADTSADCLGLANAIEQRPSAVNIPKAHLCHWTDNTVPSAAQIVLYQTTATRRSSSPSKTEQVKRAKPIAKARGEWAWIEH